MRINKKKTALFLFVAVLLGMGTFVAGGNGQGNEAVKKKEVLGKAQIIVYKKGEKILIDPDAPYFKELQLACEEMLVPVPLDGDARGAYLYSQFPSERYPFPTPEQLQNDELTISVVYEKEIKTRIVAGRAPTIYGHYLITLSGFLTPLSGEWAQKKSAFQDRYYTYLYLYSDFDEQVSTTRRPDKIKNILSQYALIP